MDGADCTKLTCHLGTNACLEAFGRRCDHPATWWVYPDYSLVWAPHVPLRRKHWTGAPCPRPVPPEQWKPGMPNRASTYPTQEKKAYPGSLNIRPPESLVHARSQRVPVVQLESPQEPDHVNHQALPENSTPMTGERLIEDVASSIACSVSTKRYQPGVPVSAPQAPADHIFQQGPIKPASLRGIVKPSKADIRAEEDRQAIGGMRNPSSAMQQLPKARAL